MITQLNCKDFLDSTALCLDVRSPSEYEEGAIINAKNLPLLNNENRKAIGICYKQSGKDAAIALGYELINPIRQTFIDQLNLYATNGLIKIYCARGGLRSHKMAEYLNENGYKTVLLKGGYKAYRNHVIETISKFKNIMILAGNTGCGKTEILEQLKQQGEQVLDLENLANHKGSAFGAIGEKPQPTNAQFSNLIFERLRNYLPEKRLWIESESVNIGKVGLPEELWKNMLTANGIEIVLPLEKRVDYIVNCYGKYDKEHLKASVQKLSKRLGGADTQSLCDNIDHDELHSVVNRLLKYYDKGYMRSREKTNCHNFVKLNLQSIDSLVNSKILLQHL